MTHRQSGNLAGAAILLCVAIAILSVVAGCAPAPAPTAPPAPTPQVIVKTVEVPGPTTNITPQVCVEAVTGLADALDAENNLLMALDAGDKITDAMIERVQGLDVERIFAAATECVQKAEVGS